MLKKLVKIANRLDDFGLTKEADVIDAVIQKMAQVEGVPGAKYQGGRQVSIDPGGPTVKFYASKAESIQALNRILADLVKEFGSEFEGYGGKKPFSEELVRNPPRASDTSWTPRTEAAFDAFADAVGIPDAGANWVSYAKGNGYAPSIDGILAFVEDRLPEARGSLNRWKGVVLRNVGMGSDTMMAKNPSSPTFELSPEPQQGESRGLKNPNPEVYQQRTETTIPLPTTNVPGGTSGQRITISGPEMPRIERSAPKSQ